jgi:hypothetical protein
VLARSQSKARAVAEILRAESTELGDRLRALVLCDFEEAAGTLPARLAGVMDREAGGARLALETLLADEATAALEPVLLTGRRVACGSRCLVGTRALLGEGWDAPAVNVVVDLTAATTPTSVVQARGRALRLDAGWPGKVADNWAVVCVTDQHPKGPADYRRFVRKHDRYFAMSGTGDVISGVAHVDPALSPYQPPPLAALDPLNAQMLTRAAARDAARTRWAVGAGYADEPVQTVTVAMGPQGRPLGLARRTAPRAALRTSSQRRARYWRAALAVAAVLVTVILLAAQPEALIAVALGLLAAVSITLTRTTVRVATAPSSGSLEDLAMATADALHAAGQAGQGAEAVQVEALPDGAYRARLRDVPAAQSAVFAAALDEVLSPLAQPRYIVPRLTVAPPSGPRAALALAIRRWSGGAIPATVVYHAVPSALGANKQLAATFEQAWHARVSPGDLLYTGSPEGAGILAAQRGDDPFAVTTQIRTLWR